MSRQLRQFQAGYCYHVTVRCNNREFRLIREECREILWFLGSAWEPKRGGLLPPAMLREAVALWLPRPDRTWERESGMEAVVAVQCGFSHYA